MIRNQRSSYGRSLIRSYSIGPFVAARVILEDAPWLMACVVLLLSGPHLPMIFCCAYGGSGAGSSRRGHMHPD